MKELAGRRGISSGIMTMPWLTTNTDHGCDLGRMVKVKVLDVDLTVADRSLINRYNLYWGFDSTILNHRSKRNKSFLLRNIDLYVKPYEQGC